MKLWVFMLLLILIVLSACSGGASQDDQEVVVSDVVVGDGAEVLFNGVVLEGDNLALPIVAQNDEGETFNMSELAGEYVLVNFGYTSCPDICPLTLGTLANAYKGLEEAQQEEINVIFVTLDPQRDTPERLDAYLKAFSEDFTGLYIPDEEQLETVKAAYGVFSEIRKAGEGEAVDSENYFVDHTGGVYVVGPDGTFELFFPHDANADAIRSDLVTLLEG